MEEKRGEVLETFKSEIPYEGYQLVPTGNALVSRRVRKRTLDSGRDVVELKEWKGQSRKGYPSVIGNYVPSDVVKMVYQEVAEKEAKDERKVEKKREPERLKVYEAFHSIYPFMPEDVRDAIYLHAWDDEFPNRVGHAKDLDITTKVVYASEAWMLHERTDFHEEVERQQEEIYERYAKELEHEDRDIREMNYDDFRAEKSEAYEMLKDDYIEVAKQKLLEYKNK